MAHLDREIAKLDTALMAQHKANPPDPNLAAAVIYVVAAVVYVRREHGPACRMILAVAALMLALCAAPKSDALRYSPYLHRHPAVGEVLYARPAAAMGRAAA